MLVDALTVPTLAMRSLTVFARGAQRSVPSSHAPWDTGMESPHSWNGPEATWPNWFSVLLKRHPDKSIRAPQAASQARASMFNRSNVSRVLPTTRASDVSVSNPETWNADETAITSVQKPRSIVAPKGNKQVGGMTSAEKGQLVRMVTAANALVNMCPPPRPRKRKAAGLM